MREEGPGKWTRGRVRTTAEPFKRLSKDNVGSDVERRIEVVLGACGRLVEWLYH